MLLTAIPLVGVALFLVQTTPRVGAQEAGAPQETNAVFDPYPLRPPDTSSPRDTLGSFLTNINSIIEVWRHKDREYDPSYDRAYVNTLETLDFSTTPEGESWWVRNQHMLLLKEILDRIELPPENEIPGDEEVEAGDIEQWIIPNTKITIARMEDGPRKGDFLFSAATVQRLAKFYRLAKDLPYKPGAAIGIYEEYLNSETTTAHEMRLNNRLKKINTSSPQSTLEGFLTSVDRAYTLLTKTDAALKAKPPTMTKEEALQNQEMANHQLHRAMDTLDLSQVAKALRERAGLETVLQLKEVMDRTVLPFLEAVPDAQAVEEARQRPNLFSGQAAVPFRWRYPNTEIEIVEVMEGERQGQFLFSPATVSRIGLFYEKVRDLPYRGELLRANRSKYDWAGESEGFYEYFLSSPGRFLSGASLVGSMVDNLPAWLKSEFGGQRLWQWMALAISLLFVFLVLQSVTRALRKAAQNKEQPLRSWLRVLEPIAVTIIVIIGVNIIDNNTTGEALATVIAAGKAIVAVMVIWAISRLLKAVAETIIASPKIPDESVDASLLRISARILTFLIGCIIIIEAVQELGVDMVPLLAGFGVGGLAVALAAQRTFADFIGSLILFVNRPVRVGDFCRYGDQIGTIEQIGLISTRIRSLERTLITVPNAEFSQMKLENYAKRDQRLFKTVLQLRYETTPEQMRFVLAKLRELLLGHPKVTPDPARVRFIGYGAYSKDLEIFAYLHCQDQNIFLAIQEDLLLRIEDIIVEAGTGFAFPSQTTYFTRDAGLDEDQAGEAEARVKQWRVKGKFPFPEFGSEERKRLEDVLDYPPKGSPDYKPSSARPDQPPTDRPATFSKAYLPMLPSLAAKLQESKPLATHLRSLLSEETHLLLSNYSGGPNKTLQEALLNDLNAIVLGPPIYEETRFSEVERREETQDLLSTNPKGPELARLNRLLLEDAFPQELLKNPRPKKPQSRPNRRK